MVPLNDYLVLSAVLFAIGTAGVFLRRNLITVLLSVEIMMYMTEGSEISRPRVPGVALAGLLLATAAVLYLGVLPTRVIDLALDSIATIF